MVATLPDNWTAANGRIEILKTPDKAAPFLAAWEDLARHSADPNMFYEQWVLLPGWEELGDPDVFLALVFDSRDQLIGLFPLSYRSEFRKLRFPIVQLWQHVHCPLCTPLLRSGREADAVRLFGRWLKANHGSRVLLVGNLIHGAGSTFETLRTVLPETGCPLYEEDRFDRPAMVPAEDVAGFPKKLLGSWQRRNLRQKLEALGALGVVDFSVCGPHDDWQEWFERFIELEQSGWKGEGGTALARREAELRFFRRMSAAARERGQLLLYALRLDGHPIAMALDYNVDGVVYTVKIAYENQYRDYRIGIQLLAWHFQQLQELSGFRLMDSCAAPDLPMFKLTHITSYPVATLVASTGTLRGNLIVRLMPTAKKLVRRIREWRTKEDPEPKG